MPPTTLPLQYRAEPTVAPSSTQLHNGTAREVPEMPRKRAQTCQHAQLPARLLHHCTTLEQCLWHPLPERAPPLPEPASPPTSCTGTAILLRVSVTPCLEVARGPSTHQPGFAANLLSIDHGGTGWRERESVGAGTVGETRGGGEFSSWLGYTGGWMHHKHVNTQLFSL